MSDIRLKEAPYEIDGKTYILRCNFNVLADIQEEYGDLPDIEDSQKILPNLRIYLSAMVNDYADEQGWPERFTPRQIGRKIKSIDADLVSTVTRLILTALYIQTSEEKEPDHSKN